MATSASVDLVSVLVYKLQRNVKFLKKKEMVQAHRSFSGFNETNDEPEVTTKLLHVAVFNFFKPRHFVEMPFFDYLAIFP